MTPESISAMIAPSSGRSTVHHHSESGLRSSRESMGDPWAGLGPLVAQLGYRGVKGIGKLTAKRSSSPPGLTRPSMPFVAEQGVDHRDKPGDDWWSDYRFHAPQLRARLL